MKKLVLTTLILILFLSCYSQSTKTTLSNKTQLTCKDLLDIRLQILAAQMTCGSYSIIDMGRIEFPVSISINDQNEIIFKIEGNLNNQLSKEKQKEIMSEGFLFVKTGITEMISEKFADINFDCNKNIVGYWYLKDAYDPCAKWVNEIFEWINN